MALEYSLYIKGKVLTFKEIKDILSRNCIKVNSTSENYDTNYQISDFGTDIGLQITVKTKGNYTYGHPAYAIDTVFSENEFVYDFRVTFRHEKFYENISFQDRIMYLIIFEIVDYLDSEAILFGPGGEDICYLGRKSNYFVKEDLAWIRKNHEDIIQNRKIICFDSDFR